MADKVFRVSIPNSVLERLREWSSLATARDVRQVYIDDLKHLRDQLKSAPESWGDPMYDLDAAQLVVYRGLTEFLRVFYAVHLRDRQVFVRNVELRHDRRLGQTKPD